MFQILCTLFFSCIRLSAMVNPRLGSIPRYPLDRTFQCSPRKPRYCQCATCVIRRWHDASKRFAGRGSGLRRSHRQSLGLSLQTRSAMQAHVRIQGDVPVTLWLATGACQTALCSPLFCQPIQSKVVHKHALEPSSSLLHLSYFTYIVSPSRCCTAMMFQCCRK